MITSRPVPSLLVLAACTGPEEQQPPPTPPEAFLPQATGDCPGFVERDGYTGDPRPVATRLSAAELRRPSLPDSDLPGLDNP